MGDGTRIGWCDATWNPIIGCSRVSAGCTHCYAERQAFRCAAMGWSRYEGLTKKVGSEIRWTGEVRFVPEVLAAPFRWTKPRRIFVNSMSDLFHEKVGEEWIDQIFAVMGLAPQHTFQVLTKRPERMLDYLRSPGRQDEVGTAAFKIQPGSLRIRERAIRKFSAWPLPNVHLGVSVEDQATADERIPLLLQTPAAVRWVSYEPALGPVDFTRALRHSAKPGHCISIDGEWWHQPGTCPLKDWCCTPILDWIVVGGESGPGARPFDLAWATRTVEQCRDAGVPAFVKQLGSMPFAEDRYNRLFGIKPRTHITLRNRKGADPSEWPEDLRVQEFPR